MNESSSKQSRQRSYWPFVKWSCFFVMLIFLARRAEQIWVTSPSVTIEVQWLWLIPAAIAYLLGWLPSVWFWRALLRSMHQQLGWSDAIRAHYVGQLGKYAPGKALVLVIRGSLVKDAGVNPVLAGVTAAYESLIFMEAGTMLCLALAPVAFGDSIWSKFPASWMHIREFPILFATVAVLCVIASAPITSLLFTRLGRKTIPKLGSDAPEPPSISARLICQGILVTSLGWCCHALSLGFVIRSVSRHSLDVAQFPSWLGACSLSTVGGFVILIAPGGIGVREGLLIEVLKDEPQIGPTLAIVVAGLLRLVWFVTELIAAGILSLVKRRS